jgi:hypothetical protein
MPTGYTEKILNGCSFEEFVLGCACAFSYGCYNIDNIIPEMNSRINYNREIFSSATKKYNDFCKLDDDSLLETYDKYVKSRKETDEKNIKEKNETKEKYENMLKIIEKWECPKENKDLKEFMIKQINESIDHDCFICNEMYTEPYEKWVLQRKESLLHTINLYGEDLIKLEKNLLETKKWIESLKKSLEKI